MTSEMQNLCLAIVAFLGFGESAWPLHDRDRVTDVFGPELLEKVLSILDEVDSVDMDWSNNLALADAGALVRCEMQSRYPELDDAALDAIAWKYTFDWR
jgi:hypothetical protein